MIRLTTGDISITAANRSVGRVRMWWLGQAGFLFRTESANVLVDPYLSNSLAKKYANGEFPHHRMMPVPVVPERLQEISAVLCTHGHTDHMDPETLSVIAEISPDADFLVPRALRSLAVERGVPKNRLLDIDAGETIESLGGLRVEAVPAAHESIEKDANGNHKYLGYVFSLEGVRFLHSGDTVAYDGQVEFLKDSRIDVALLPINGRDEHRRSRGVPGNMTLEEAVRLADDVEAAFLVCHHWGMFDFNTADPKLVTSWLQERGYSVNSWHCDSPPRSLRVVMPEVGTSYDWAKEP